MTLPAFELTRRTERHVWRKTFLTPQRSLSFGWLTMGVKASMLASNFADMSVDEVIFILGVGWIING